MNERLQTKSCRVQQLNFSKILQELKAYRAGVDQQVEQTINILRKKGFIIHAHHLSHQLKTALEQGRQAVR